MTLADLSIKRPIFITCTVIAMLVVGYLSLKKLGVDLFPNVTFPVVTVSTPYPGAGPREVETLVSKVLEDQISTVAGIKRLRSLNKEGVSIVIAEFTLETDVKFAEQQVRDKVSSAKIKLPKESKESIIRRVDPADQPIITITVSAELPEAKLYDLADQSIRPKIEQIKNVGLVEVLGGRKREIRVELDRKKLN
ncbi:MAG: efflux RND transporter permease subunit, partial [Deltaproteobacteria bacterium]|nr:efflux RND transporter permease subunit [Deltaproteobacteria bacterium]